MKEEEKILYNACLDSKLQMLEEIKAHYLKEIEKINNCIEIDSDLGGGMISSKLEFKKKGYNEAFAHICQLEEDYKKTKILWFM